MKNLLVSIITVVYNGEEFLQQTIDSIRNQTYSNIEYIIIDGGSTDKTISIIKNNKDVITSWISEKDAGLYDAMNKGIKMSTGELIGIVNSDDWYEKNAVELNVKEYFKNPSKKIFHADKRCINSDGTTFVRKAKNHRFLIKYHGMVLNHPTMFIHKSIYENNEYNTKLSSLSDYQLVLTIYNQDNGHLHYIPEVVSNYRLGGISAKLKLSKSIRENFIARRNAGLNIIECYFAISLRFFSEGVKKIKK